MKTRFLFLLTLGLFLFVNPDISAQSISEKAKIQKVEANQEKLVVLWTSGDIEVAKKMVFMYTYNAKKYGWWKDITFIIWGPSSKLLAEDTELQEYLKKMKDEGIIVEACKACTDMYEVSDKLTELGVDVKYMGQVLTDYIRGEEHVITF